MPIKFWQNTSRAIKNDAGKETLDQAVYFVGQATRTKTILSMNFSAVVLDDINDCRNMAIDCRIICLGVNYEYCFVGSHKGSSLRTF